MSESILEVIKKELAENKVVLFMKGTPVSPQCGFSSMAAQIMQHCDVPYKAINVLENNEIREGIKVYSDWPTIPQLYINGEFIGGCDIMKEMFEEGELKSTLEA